MSEELAKYEYEVGFPKKYSTEYKWTLKNWSQVYDLISNEGVTCNNFYLNGTNGYTCRILLSPKTPRKVFIIEFSDTQAIEAMKVKISTGDKYWNADYRKPISKIFKYRMGDDVPKKTFVPNKNGAVIILFNITIVKVSDTINLLNPTARSPQMPSSSNPSQNILANFKKMFNRKAFCDVTFVLGDETFHAHKAVLAAQSKVFEAMFLSGMKEQSDNTIEISNFDAEIFEQFLNYLYGEGGMKLENKVEEMIVIADYYNVSDLKIRCENIMLETLSENSAIRYVILADKINCDTLKTAALHFIRKSSTIIEKAVLEEDTATMTDLKEILSKNQPGA